MIRVVWAREPLPTTGPSVFLAGPTPRAGTVPSWRPDALDLLAELWTGLDTLPVLVPESRGGVRAEHYDDQFAWETAARAVATVVVFWIPRDLATLPGFTTNVEFGHDVTTGRAVLGCPPDCPNPERNRYLVALARHYSAPVRDTLRATLTCAVDYITRSASTF